MKKIITFSVILIGFTAMASQIIYMRQLLVVFYGNELSISFILASWLIGGAIGSSLLGKFTDKIRSKISTFSICQILLGVLLPLGIIEVRLIKPFLNVSPGEMIPLFPIILASFVILAPVCIILGFMFSLACCIYDFQPRLGDSQPRPGMAIGNVYILEALGSLMGGTLTSIVLIKLFDPIHITAIFAVLNILASFLLVLYSSRAGFASRNLSKSRVWFMRGLNPPYCCRKLFLLTTAIFIIAIIVAWTAGGLRELNQYLLKKQWQGYDLIASKDSIYGNIAVAKKEESYSFFENGLHQYSIPDHLNAEEAAHLTLLEHPDPQDILLIGGGVGGLVEEVLKEPVKKIDYVELDPLLILMAEKYLPDNYYKAMKDKRVSIKNTDGRFYVKTTKEKYDCIIVHVGDPYTAQTNRYYTEEFFKEAKKILKEGGIVSFSLTSCESYISPPLGEFLSSIYRTVKDVFSDCLIMPGEIAYFIASDEKGILTYDYKILEERTKKRALDTQYVREYYMFSKLSPQKISYIDSVLKKSKDARGNYDLRPISYYYGLIFWTTLFKDSVFSKILKSINEELLWKAIGSFIILLTLILVSFRRSFKRTALVAIAAGGFSTMAFQVLILLAFQIMYGYLFYKLGIILTAFMAGLAIGAFFAVKVIHSNRGRLNVPYGLIAVQGDFVLFSLILPIFFIKFGSSLLFPVMSVIAGFIGGAQFPLVNKVLLGKREDAGRVGGLSYGVDLFGSFLGALLTGVFLIPILGIPKTCLAIAIINLAVLGLLLINVSIEE